MEYYTLNDEIYIRWRKFIVTFCYLAWVGVTVAELLGGIVMDQGMVDIHWNRYIKFYVILPAVFDFACITVIALATSSKRLTNKVKDYVMMTMLCLIGGMLTTVHNYFMIISTVMVIPILCSGMFQNKRLITFTTALSISISWMALHCSTLLEGKSATTERIINMAMLNVIQLMCGMISAIVNRIYRERELKLSKLQNSHQQLEERVRIDGLTGLLNHTSFYEELDRSMKEYRLNHQTFAVVMMDIDNFKQTNDIYGHQTGDDLLRGASQTLLHELEGKATVFRYGGDEFAMICSNGDPYAVYDMLENCRKQIIETGRQISQYAVVDASFGIHMVKNADLSSRQIVEKADAALRNAKSLGKGRIHVGS